MALEKVADRVRELRETHADHTENSAGDRGPEQSRGVESGHGGDLVERVLNAPGARREVAQKGGKKTRHHRVIPENPNG